MKSTLALCLLAMIGCAPHSTAGSPDAGTPGTPDSPGNPGNPGDAGNVGDAGDAGDAGGSDGSGGSGDPGTGDDPPPFTDGVSTLSGAADAGYVDGTRGKARFANPVNVAVAPDGMVYVADFDNSKIRIVDPANGTTSTSIALQGFQRPFGMAFAGDGTLYVSTDNDPQGAHSPMSGTIWKIDVHAKTATPIAAGIGRPRGIAVLPTGQIVATDYVHEVLQLVDPSTGKVQLLAGAWDEEGCIDALGGAARFATPYGVVVVNGQIVVADYGNDRLRKVGLDGSVTTLAGDGVAGFADGALATARFNKPQGLAATAGGDIYVTDLDNYRVRRISGDTIETIAGNGSAGYADNDDRLAAQFFGLEGISVTPDGAMVFVADGGRGENMPFNRVRSIRMP